MNRDRRVETILWALTTLAIAWGILGWGRAIPSAEATPSVVTSAPPAPHLVSSAALSAAVAETVENDPFRLERRPAAVPYGPEPLIGGVPLPTGVPSPSRPELAISGIIGGSPREALIEGIPGRQGSVLVRQGDVVGDFRIQAIEHDTVHIEGADTTWKLTLKQPWS